jgi:hypothetical protein
MTGVFLYLSDEFLAPALREGCIGSKGVLAAIVASMVEIAI